MPGSREERGDLLWKAPSTGRRPPGNPGQLHGRLRCRPACKAAMSQARTPLRQLSGHNPYCCDRPSSDNPLITRAGASGRDRETSVPGRPRARAWRRLRLWPRADQRPRPRSRAIADPSRNSAYQSTTPPRGGRAASLGVDGLAGACRLRWGSLAVAQFMGIPR
jgi:hypothetical protein